MIERHKCSFQIFSRFKHFKKIVDKFSEKSDMQTEIIEYKYIFTQSLAPLWHKYNLPLANCATTTKELIELFVCLGVKYSIKEHNKIMYHEVYCFLSDKFFLQNKNTLIRYKILKQMLQKFFFSSTSINSDNRSF